MSLLLRGIILISLFISSTYASFVLENNNILIEKSILKIEEIGTEVKIKTDISIYIIAKENLAGKKILEYEKEVSKNIKPPFIILTFAQLEQKVDIISSSNIQNQFDKDEVLNDFIIPILVSKSKGKSSNKFGAALFNGYAEIADQIAKHNNIELKSSIGSEGRESYNIVVYIIWLMLLSFFGTFLYVFFKRK